MTSHLSTTAAASTVPSAAAAAVTTTSTDVFLVPCLPLSPQSRSFDYEYGCKVWLKSRNTSRQPKAIHGPVARLCNRSGECVWARSGLAVSPWNMAMHSCDVSS